MALWPKFQLSMTKPALPRTPASHFPVFPAMLVRSQPTTAANIQCCTIAVPTFMATNCEGIKILKTKKSSLRNAPQVLMLHVIYHVCLHI